VNWSADIASEQGVWHDWPFDVRASAPAGSDSNCMVLADGAPLGMSNCIQLGMLEQALRPRPHATMTTNCFMVEPHSGGREAALLNIRSGG
jgi:hypothetical protein